MVDFVEYVVSELKSRRLAKAGALELLRQFMARPAGDARLHPLLHRNVSTLSRQCYRTRLDGDAFYLRDHRVRMADGVLARVLPGVAYLEMARAAIADAVPDLAAGSTLAFEDVLWLAPLLVDGAREIEIAIELDDDDADAQSLRFQILSEDADGGAQTEHASGRLRFFEAAEPPSLGLEAIRAQLQRDRWPAALVYQRYAEAGIEYGPAHRGIETLLCGERQVLAEIVLPEAIAGEDRDAWGLHPALLDAALQAAIGLGERDAAAGETMLPFALDSLCILAPLAERLLAFVRRIDPADGVGGQLSLDLDLCDAEGRICVQMRGFHARRLEPAAGASARSTTLLAVPEWEDYRPLAMREPAPAARQARRVLLCELPAIDRDRLAAEIGIGRIDTVAGRVEDDLPARYQAAALALFEALQAALPAAASEPVLLQCVIADRDDSLLAGLGAMLKTATLEQPKLVAQLLLVEPRLGHDALAARLQHAGAHSEHALLQYQGERWRVPRWRLLPDGLDGPSERPYREDGVYLVSGGLGGLGRRVAADILQHTQRARVVLSGRAAADQEIVAQLAALGFAGRLHYRQIDLQDAAQCRDAVEQIGREIGPLRGVLHCAGSHRDAPLLKKSAADLLAVLAPKLHGSWHLDAATAALDLDFFALFASAVGVFGNVGQADYAAANGFLDAFALHREQQVTRGERRGRTLAIDWPLWQDGGMRPDAQALDLLQARSGMRPLATATGLALLARALLSPHVQLLALEGDPARLRRLFDPPAPPAGEVAPAAAGPARAATARVASGDLPAQARELLRHTFAPVLLLAPAQIDVQEALEHYGINSIVAMNLTAQLETQFGPLSKTLFFEYQTIAALADHLVEAHAERLQALLGRPATEQAATAPTPPAPVRASARDPARRLRGKATAPVRRAPAGGSHSREPIAVIGLSGRYPQAETLADFWRNLRDGRDCIGEVPPERWRWQDYCDADGSRGGHSSRWGGFIDGAELFDPQFFNISPREAPYIDPQERLFLEHAWMAIEDAGYSRRGLRIPRPAGLPGQVGVYAGVMYGEYNRSGSLASIANRVSYVLNLHGPSMTLDSMCSSSLTAIHLACQDLKLGRTDMALAGGVNLSLHPGKYSMLSAGQFISSDGHCASFGEGGDGYIPGEGVGVVLLKRLSDAERDGDAIHAVIRGSALNHGGKTNGYTVPNPQAQAAVIADALADAGVHPREVSYLEAHGTGTTLGDPIEIAALGRAFGAQTADTGFCLIGSAKSNIGHCESAAGVAGLTKVILQLRHRQIVPSLHSERLNPNIDFERTPFVVNQQLRAWDAPVVDGRARPRIAGLSSFGAGGSNAHFVIEEYCAPAADSAATSATAVIVPLSARTPEQLVQKAADLRAFLERADNPPLDLHALAWTLQVGREPMDERLALVVDSIAALHDALGRWLDGEAAAGYRAQVRAHRDTLSLFTADPEFDETLDKWIAQRKLAKLADLWAKGLELDWMKFHPGRRPHRHHLPTYPFARERYWIDPIQGLFPTEAPVPPRAALHPLLHENSSELGQLRYSSVFRPDDALFAGAGGPVLPAAALLDMARAALVRAAGSDDSDTVRIEFRELVFGAAFSADGATPLHIALLPADDGGIAFDIYSDAGAEQVHLQGSGVLLDRPAPAVSLDAFFHAASTGAPLVAPSAVLQLPKPAAIRLAEPTELAAIVARPLPKPRARLAMLDAPAVTPPPNRSADLPAAAVAPAAERRAETPVPDASRAAGNLKELLRRTLAQALYLDAAGIDDERSFVELGLDSIVGVEWVKRLNRELGVEIAATRVYDYASIDALSGYLRTLLPAQQPTASLPAVTRSAQATTAGVPTATVPAATALAPAAPLHELQQALRASLAKALYLDPQSIDDDRPFIDLGLDSIVGVEWVKAINARWGLEIPATRVYDYANIRQLAGFLREELAKRPPEPAAQAAATAPTVVTPESAVLPQAPAASGLVEHLAPLDPSAPVPILQRRRLAARQAGHETAVAGSREPIAIIGMSGRYPDAADLGEFWQNLAAGRDSIKPIPAERWDVDAWFDPEPGKPGKVYCKWLGLLDGADRFDPLFFQISPSEAEVMDPQHRLFMQESYRAFEDAGYAGAALGNTRCGVYLGIMSNEYSYLLARGNSQSVETTANSFAIGAARIAYHLNLKGPAIPIDTACSSSLVAMHLACQALQNGEIDMALAGGVSLYLIPESYVGMCRAGMLSRDGRCKTFDNGADGFVPGEGVGTVVLKRLSDAERDGDGIYGVIIGSGINQDGKTNGITAPSVNSQIELEREVYRRHRIDARTISYVETHGTGTKLGDPIELEALSTVFKEHDAPRQSCALGAVKTNIGHVSGAAGVAGVHKVLLSLRHGKLAPNLHLARENALFDFGGSPFFVNRELRDWSAPAGGRRRAAVSAFGFSGTNAHLVIEEYLPAARREQRPRRQIIPLSARTAAQLQARAEALLRWLDGNGSDAALPDLAWTLQLGRDAMRERCAFVVDSIDELLDRLSAFVAGATGDGVCQRGTVARSEDGAALGSEAAALWQRDGLAALERIAAAWCRGAEFDWRMQHDGARPQRLHLPGYPFANERYWVDAAPPAPVPLSDAPAAVAVDAASAQPVCYLPGWRAAPLPAHRSPFAAGHTLLLLDTDDRLFEQVKARLQPATALDAVVLVALGTGFIRHAGDRFEVDPRRPQDFAALLDALAAQGRRPSHVIQNLDPARVAAAGDAAALEFALQVGIDAMFGLCKALATGAQQAPCRLVSFFHADSAFDHSACAALEAFHRSLALENNRYHGSVVALEHRGIDPASSAIDTLTAVLDELLSADRADHAVRYRASGAGPAERLRRVLEPAPTASQPLAELPLKQRGVYLVTGGLGGLGLLFARHLAERYQARLVLSGRSALDARGQTQIDQLRALGAEVLYQPADVADAGQVQALLDRARAAFGVLNGVLHVAGVNRDALLIHKDRAALREVLAPKVFGCFELDRLSATEALDLFVLFSSGAGSFGNAGQADYAYANAYLDAFAEQREALRARGQRSGRTLSIAWPYWQDGGMQVAADELRRIEQRSGLCALPTAVGIAHWDALLRSDATRALALYGDPARIAVHCAGGASREADRVAPAVDADALLAATRRYLCERVEQETRVAADAVDPQERFEAYGFDSVMIGRFNSALEHDLGELPKTLLYEYETVADLAAYLCESVPAALSHRLFAAPPAASAELPAAVVDASIAAAVVGEPLEPIAIIGLHACFPQAADLDTFWDHLQAGRELVDQVPATRWDQAAFSSPDPARPGSIYCNRGGFLDGVDRFDAAFFNIADAEAAILDPQERLCLQSAWAAIEDAGYTRERLRARHPRGRSADVGVFIGVTSNTYGLLAPEAAARGEAVTPSAMPWSIANRISYQFDFRGPSQPVDTACSSSLVAVHHACEALRRGECQVALAGGVNLYLHPAKYQSLCQRRMLAEHGSTRSYGTGDDGFVPGEGVGTLVLKPLSIAERDGDRIHGVIRASAVEHSGRSNGYAAPNPNAQAQVIGAALARAGVPARSIGFIEGHGTGTRMGDSLEVAAITQAFGRDSGERQFCALASLKANFGHAESATSIAGIAKILLQFRHGQIAPSIHADPVNPDIDFARSPCVLQTTLVPWPRPDDAPRRALINAFGAGGVNACAVIEEYVGADDPASPPGRQLFVLSARSRERLRAYAARQVEHLRRAPEVDLARLCHTLQSGREALAERLALVVDDTDALHAALLRWLDADQASDPAAGCWCGRADPPASAGVVRAQREQAAALAASGELAALAAAWVAGAEVDWMQLHAGRPPRPLSLPTYPFAPTRHWISAHVPGTPLASPRPARLHPLLSHNISTLKQVRFEAALDPQAYYAREHRVQGRALFPGAGLLEMACVAATLGGQRRVRELRDIVWVQPLAFGESAPAARVCLLNPSEHGAEFGVMSLDDAHQSHLHCEGRVVFEQGRAPHAGTRSVMGEWRARCSEPRSAAALYDHFARAGIEYGAAFRVIEQVAVGDGCALATLQLGAAQAADFEQYILHPCLIDGALQAVIALLAADGAAVPHLPFAIDALEILGSLTPRCHVAVERAGTPDPRSQILQFNLQLLSESGEPLVRIDHFYLRALPAAEPSAGTRAAQPSEVNP